MLKRIGSYPNPFFLHFCIARFSCSDFKSEQQAVSTGSSILLNWQTATEVNNYGFEVERSQTRVTDGQASNAKSQTWEKIGLAQGHRNSNSPKEYSFTDKNSSAGKVQYRLKQIDFNGKYEYSDVVEVNLGTPANFAVHQNYPNPFNPSTAIKFSLPADQYVTIKLFDAQGREVQTLLNEFRKAGEHVIIFKAQNISSGIYFYRLTAGNNAQVKKMTLLK